MDLIKTSAMLSLALLLNTGVQAADSAFDNRTLACQMPASTPVLPKKYQHMAWARRASPAAQYLTGESSERGNHPVAWYVFQKADIDADGYCDWLVTLGMMPSSGYSVGSTNIIYRGRPRDWERIGPTVTPRDNPIDLGDRGHDRDFDFDWFEDAATIREQASNKTYVIGFFSLRHTSRSSKPGYHIYTWQPTRRTLVELDKWGDASEDGARAYAFFKQHGASRAGDKEEFDLALERDELSRDEDVLRQQCRAPDGPMLGNKCEAARAHFPEWFAR